MDTAARSKRLAAIPLFERLSEEHRRRVASQMSVRTFGAGERLLSQGAPGDCVLVLVDGRVNVRLRRHDREEVLAIVGPGAVLGEMALVTGSPRNADAVATSEGRVLVLRAEAFHALATETPGLVDLLTEVVAERLGRAAQDGLGDKVLAGYRVIRPVGRGGMAVVYEAERLSDGGRVALKMMSHLFARDADALARFDREAEVLARFEHEGITRCHGRFSAYGTVFLVLDFVDGVSLADVIERRGPLPESETRGAFGSIAAALAHVHRHGVAHGDVKPSNVLVDRTGRLRLTDFGIARRIVGAEDARADAVPTAGTPRYMAPEQFVGSPPSRATDLYALGCVLAEMATGRPLFPVQSVGELLVAKRGLDAEGFAQAGGITDSGLRAAVTALLAPEPSARGIDLDRWAEAAGPLSIQRVADAADRTFFIDDAPTTLGT